MILEKVYDELYGMIEDLKKQIQSGSAPSVDITPTLESGVKIADFSIGSDEGSLYAPSEKSGVFSSTPVEVGTWTDGKPLYREVITAAITTAASTIDLDDPTNKTVVFFEAVLDTEIGSDEVLLPIYAASSTDRFLINYDLGAKQFSTYSSGYSGTVCLIVYFTDDTDTIQNTSKKKKTTK